MFQHHQYSNPPYKTTLSTTRKRSLHPSYSVTVNFSTTEFLFYFTQKVVLIGGLVTARWHRPWELLPHFVRHRFDNNSESHINSEYASRKLLM